MLWGDVVRGHPCNGLYQAGLPSGFGRGPRGMHKRMCMKGKIGWEVGKSAERKAGIDVVSSITDWDVGTSKVLRKKPLEDFGTKE